VLISLRGLANAESCDAKATWEKMILAKGGRERLDSVQSLLVSESYSSRRFLSSHRIERRKLFRFPDFVWSWDDIGAPFGVTVSQADFDRGYGLSVRGPSASPHVEREPVARNSLQAFGEAAMLLLETRWTKPILVGCEVEGWTTIIEVHFPDDPYSLTYHLERDSYLPSRVDRPEGRGTLIYRLSGYAPVRGIMLPGKFRLEFGTLPAPLFDRKYEINPDYDRLLPDREPSVQAGPNAWRNPTAGRSSH